MRWVCLVSHIVRGVRFIPIKMIRHLPISLKIAGRKNSGTKKKLPSLEQGRLHPFDRNESKYCFLMHPELNVSAPLTPNRCLGIYQKKKKPFLLRSPIVQRGNNAPLLSGTHNPNNQPPRSLHLTHLLTLHFYPSCFTTISMKEPPRAFAHLPPPESYVHNTYDTVGCSPVNRFFDIYVVLASLGGSG